MVSVTPVTVPVAALNCTVPVAAAPPAGVGNVTVGARAVVPVVTVPVARLAVVFGDPFENVTVGVVR